MLTKKKRLVMGSPASFLSPHFNSLLEVREMTSREKQGEGESSGEGRREEGLREQVDSLINNHKVRQAVPG